MLIKILRIIFLLPIVGLAQQAAASPPAESHSEQSESSCIDVQVNGARSLSYNCMAQQMTPPKEDPRRRNPTLNSTLASERATRLPPTQTGLFTSLHQRAISNSKD
ncbi:hypothetical protein PA14OR_4178 [Pseudomonas aeruginosa]|jgi:hypothetical protein|uniref:Secreted protein n=3 Tax=Pseudomonas aeruginosa TaxID=287 RepID=Q7WZ20_PSEAI|nr:conserved hypothetical protein [Pseudomonas aeruginosa PA14]ABJ10144.1 hypothetical protein PA14_51590 [Pseudomonas aeruginosa UCBPP-PA14]SCM64068.1 hypothetical protein PA14OR_4178 [Pseudomonas aeruginosa]